MSQYEQLVKALRETAAFEYTGKLLSKREQKLENLAFDAAAAIEALQAQLPKRGKWVLQASGQDCKCSACGAYWIPFGDEYDYKFCPNCGAKMEEKC